MFFWHVICGFSAKKIGTLMKFKKRRKEGKKLVQFGLPFASNWTHNQLVLAQFLE